MIQVQTIIDRCNALLDSEGSDRYTWEQDFQYAIPAAVDHVISIYNKVYSRNKLSEEALRELTYVKVFQASAYSRIAFDATDIGHKIWTIFAVYPKCTTTPSFTVSLIPVESAYLSNYSFLDSDFSAKRITGEQWAMRNRNKFIAGSSLMTCDELKEYAYLNPADYTGGYNLTNDKFEITISPSVAGEAVAVRYAKYPTVPTATTSNIELPSELLNLIVDLTMRFIGVKQGEYKTYEVTNAEINQLVNLMT